MKRAIVLYILLALAMVGVVDTFYLTLAHYRGTAPNCVLLRGCDVVAASEYASIGPVPLALLGLVYYVALAALLWFAVSDKRLIQTIFLLSGLGFLFSLYLLYLQVAVIGAVCVYCIASLATTTLIAVGSVALLCFGTSSRVTHRE